MCISAAAAGVIGAISAVASAGVGVYSSIQQGKSAKEQAEYNASIADYNARVAENKAQDDRNIATDKENIHRTKVQKLVSSQRAKLGASGVDLGVGSAVNLIDDTMIEGDADALRIRSLGDSQYASGMQSGYLTSKQGENILAQGDAAQSQSMVNAGSSLLSGAGNFIGSGVADKWFTSSSAANTTSPFITSSNPLGLTAGQGL